MHSEIAQSGGPTHMARESVGPFYHVIVSQPKNQLM